MTAFQTFFDAVEDASLESKPLAEFTRLVLGNTAITNRNDANATSYRRYTEGDRWAHRKFAGVYGAALLEKATIKDFLEINSAMGASKPDAPKWYEMPKIGKRLGRSKPPQVGTRLCLPNN